MPVLPWDGVPLFGGKTLVLPGGAYKRRTPPTAAVAADPDAPDQQPIHRSSDDWS